MVKAKVRRRVPPRSKRPASRRVGPFCGRIKKDGKPCQNLAGYRTPHPGQGQCFKHGGNIVRMNGRYSNVVHDSLREKLDQIANDEVALMDLAPEATLLRALTIDFVNRYELFSQALLKWYATNDASTKPRRIMDIADAGRLVEAISRVVHRMHQIQQEGAISLETFRRVTEMMGVVVTKHVTDPETLFKIEQEWAALPVDAKGSTAASTEDADTDDRP